MKFLSFWVPIAMVIFMAGCATQQKSMAQSFTEKNSQQNIFEKVEILSGLKVNQTYVNNGAFTLKAQLSKSAFGDGHNH